MSNKNNLLLEAQKVDYGLRSTFFYRKLNELGFMEFGAQIDEIVAVADSYKWEAFTEWGISESAWQQIQSAGIEPMRVFAHPLICIQYPRLLAYYRSVAAISQKGAKRLALFSTIEKYEMGQTQICHKTKPGQPACSLTRTSAPLLTAPSLSPAAILMPSYWLLLECKLMVHGAMP